METLKKYWIVLLTAGGLFVTGLNFYKGVRSNVGWDERSESRHGGVLWAVLGIASLHPAYGGAGRGLRAPVA